MHRSCRWAAQLWTTVFYLLHLVPDNNFVARRKVLDPLLLFPLQKTSNTWKSEESTVCFNINLLLSVNIDVVDFFYSEHIATSNKLHVLYSHHAIKTILHDFIFLCHSTYFFHCIIIWHNIFLDNLLQTYWFLKMKLPFIQDHYQEGDKMWKLWWMLTGILGQSLQTETICQKLSFTAILEPGRSFVAGWSHCACNFLRDSLCKYNQPVLLPVLSLTSQLFTQHLREALSFLKVTLSLAVSGHDLSWLPGCSCRRACWAVSSRIASTIQWVQVKKENPNL